MSGASTDTGPPRGPLVRLAVRFPALTRVVIRTLVLRPRSRLRDRLWHWAMRIGFSTSDRRDWEFLRTYMHPVADVDLSRAGGWALDLRGGYRGPDGYVRWWEAFNEVWTGFDTGRLQVVAPPGNRVLVISHPTGRGVHSGLEVTGEMATVFTYEDGWLTRIQNFADPEEALESVGLRRRATAPPT